VSSWLLLPQTLLTTVYEMVVALWDKWRVGRRKPTLELLNKWKALSPSVSS
jgi:hypothetical protein